MLQNLSSWPPPLTDCTKSSVSNPTIPSRGKRDSAFKVAIKSRKSPLNQFRRSIFINRAYRPGCKLKAEPKKEVFTRPSPQRGGTEILENFSIQITFQPTHPSQKVNFKTIFLTSLLSAGQVH